MRKVFEILSFIIGALGLILSIYFYQVSKNEKDPTFIVEPIRTELINSNKLNNQPIKVISTSNGQEIKNDLNIVRFYFWNKGKDAIKNENILKPIQIISDKNIKILYTRNIKSSRDLCEIKEGVKDSNKIFITFKILETDDGFTGEFLYEGSPKATFKIDGAIEGVKDFSNFSVSTYSILGKTLLYIFLGILAIAVFLLTSGSNIDRRPDYLIMKDDPKYRNDTDFRKYVDELEQKANELMEIRQKNHQKISEKTEEEKGISKQKIRILIILIVIIITSIAIGFAWSTAKKDIEKTPKNYIPLSINPE